MLFCILFKTEIYITLEKLKVHLKRFHARWTTWEAVIGQSDKRVKGCKPWSRTRALNTLYGNKRLVRRHRPLFCYSVKRLAIKVDAYR